MHYSRRTCFDTTCWDRKTGGGVREFCHNSRRLSHSLNTNPLAYDLLQPASSGRSCSVQCASSARSCSEPARF
ncbi:hypothetical protein F511_35997 [Dorcoceras hygrometricum]|uniref:Uncharacterized protein n=1 Tax=Dorcoceras hygrometricum TaxID=472368 RepID=A0A2Z7CXQ2_9LAMI|nr:hypothetical protein F511_35997 [Dorcoceras hygrometricum]